MEKLLSADLWNFALYNGFGTAALIVFALYAIFLWEKVKTKSFDGAFDFAVGITILTFSKVIERTYYGAMRGKDLTVPQYEPTEILSPSWVITFVAITGIVGSAWHIRTLSKTRFGQNLLRGSILMIMGSVFGSVFWAVYLH